MHLEGGGSLMDAAPWRASIKDVGVNQKLNYSDVATTTQCRARERYCEYYGTIRKIHSKSGFAIAFPQPNDYV